MRYADHTLIHEFAKLAQPMAQLADNLETRCAVLSAPGQQAGEAQIALSQPSPLVSIAYDALACIAICAAVYGMWWLAAVASVEVV